MPRDHYRAASLSLTVRERSQVSLSDRRSSSIMALDDIDTAFRARMRALAQKGGAVTKRRHGCNLGYYRNLGRLGGKASVAARKARIAAELDRTEPGGAPIVEPFESRADVTSPIYATPPMSLSEVLADPRVIRPATAKCEPSPEVSNRRASRERDQTLRSANMRRGCRRRGALGSMEQALERPN